VSLGARDWISGAKSGCRDTRVFRIVTRADFSRLSSNRGSGRGRLVEFVDDDGGDALYRFRVREAGWGDVDMTLSSSSSGKEAFRLITVEGFCGGGWVAFVEEDDEEGERRLEGGGGLFGVTRRGKVLKGAAKGVFCGRKASGERESILDCLDCLLLPARDRLMGPSSYRGCVFDTLMPMDEAAARDQSDGAANLLVAHGDG